VPRRKIEKVPVKEAPNVVPAPTETLICEFDGHSWDRPIAKGRKPRLCLSHNDTAAPGALAKANRARAKARADNLDTALRLNGSHLDQQPQVRQSHSIAELLDRLSDHERRITQLEAS
jgi:hypothetical protein